MTKKTNDDMLTALFLEVQREVAEASKFVDWTEDEIDKAMKRYSEQADRIFHASALLVPILSSRAWGVEFVVRGHCRELLDRVGTGGNTKRGTAAECCIVMSEVSKGVPLHGAASGFYLRMWGLAFPDHKVWDDGAVHHEALYSGQMDDLERDVRRKLSVTSTCPADRSAHPAASSSTPVMTAFRGRRIARRSHAQRAWPPD